MVHKRQDLTRFLKKDIIEFLDKKAPDQDSKSSTTISSNLELFKDAIHDEDWEAASNVFAEMVENYNDISPSDIYKEVSFDKIFDAYKACKDLHVQGELKEYLKLLEEESILEGEVPNNIGVLEVKKQQEREQEFKETEKDYDKKNEIDSKIDDLQKQLFLDIRKKDVSNAVKKYKKIKKLFTEYPARFEEEKEALYDDILSLYVQIQKLSKTVSKEKSIKKQEPNNTVEKQKFEAKKFKKLIIETKNQAKRGEFEVATQNILELKHMTASLPPQKEALHAMLDQKINKLQHAIQVAKRMSENKKEKVVQN